MEDILSQAAAVLTSTTQRWTDLSQTLPAELLMRRPAPGQWSAVECLQHLVDTENVFRFRVQAFLEGRDFPAFNPDEEGTRLGAAPSAQELAAEFARRREASLEALAQLSPADLDRSARHAELGPVTLREMVHEWAAHDFNHTVQAERSLMQPFMEGCGPWIKYFQDHVIHT